MQQLHPQDWLIIFEALADWAGSPEDVDTARKDRAWDLAELIAQENKLAPTECLHQIDESWSGPN